MKQVAIIFLSLWCYFHAVAQDSTVAPAPKQHISVKKADTAFEKRQYREALNDYYAAYQASPQDANLNFKMALCYHYLLQKPEASVQLLNNSLTNTTEKYNFYSEKEAQASLDALYFKGKSFLYQNKIDSAIKYFVYYQDQMHGLAPLDVNRQLKMCMNYQQLSKYPRPVNINALSSPVNDGYQQSNPVLSIDNQTLFFSSTKPDVKKKETLLSDKDIFICQSTGNTWSEPTPFNYNTESDDEPLYLSTDGRRLYLKREGDIAVSEKGDAGWGPPVKLDGVNSTSDEAGLGLSADGTIMIIASNRPGGSGGYDLYISKNKNGKWSAPKNMGATVNSEMDEMYPFCHPTDGKMYFSSNGNTAVGMGGFDVLYTTLDSAGKWTTPRTAGYPINKGGNELGYYVTSEGRSFYSAVNSDGDFDIYEIVAGAYDPSVDELIVEETLDGLPSTSQEVAMVQLLEVEKEKIVEKEKDVEVMQMEIVESEVEKDVGYIDLADVDKVDKLVAIREKEVLVETAPLVETVPSPSTTATDDSSPAGTTTSGKTVPLDKTRSSTTNSTETAFEENAGSPVYHVVVAGETLFGLGRENNTTPAKIKEWNGLKSDELIIGQQLIVAYGSGAVTTEQSAMKKLEKTGLPKEERDAIIAEIKNYYYAKINENNTALFKTFYFGFNKKNLSLSEDELNILVTFMKENPEVNIEVIGHTDNTGQWKTNFWLSRERAKNIYDYLLSKNISSNRIIFNGKGSTMPVADNETKEGRAKNRRVEIMFIK